MTAVKDVGEPCAGDLQARFDGRELEAGSDDAKTSGDGRPRETAGMSAGYTALLGYRASSLPYHYPEPGPEPEPNASFTTMSPVDIPWAP